MGSTRLDHQIFACLCPGIESDRDTMALHEILLGTVFGVCFFLLFIRGDRTNSYPCWYRIYNRLSVSIEYAKAYVHLLRGDFLKQSFSPGSRGSGRVRGLLLRERSRLCWWGDIRYDSTSRKPY